MKTLVKVTPLVALFLAHLLSQDFALASDIIAINPGRLELIKDALSWLTLRRNGTLLTSQEVEDQFLETVKLKYTKSRYYRTFVIAFHQGVLPRLTLKEGDICDPSYTFKYKNPWNGSVTWYYQKRFTFEYYYDRYSSTQFCDYREGLVCNAATKKCQCPEGPSMSPIEPGSPVKRCLLRKGEVCALMDLNHEPPLDFRDLKRILPRLIFNLEKPESCEIGTQCRFIKSEVYTAKCHDSNANSVSTWFPKYQGPGIIQQVIPFAKECSIGLIGYSGGCDNPSWGDEIGSQTGYLCYNFGPPRSHAAPLIGATNRTGFCAHQYGQYAITKTTRLEPGRRHLYAFNFVMGFVHRRSVPFNETELKDYYKRYLDEVYFYLFGDYSNSWVHLERFAGNPCNVASTKKLEVIWKYYQALEDTPPPGNDFVPTATKVELLAKLQDLIDLVQGLASDEKICKPYWSGYWEQGIFIPPVPLSYIPPLHCVSSSSPVGSNDGTCEDSKDNSTLAYAKWVQEYSRMLVEERDDIKKEDGSVDEKILRDNPEPPCTPAWASGRRRREAHNHAETLEGGGCPVDFVCWEDWSDDTGIYDGSCELQTPNPKLRNICHDSKDGVNCERCELRQLDKLIAREVDRITEYATLGRGDSCRKDVEEYFREWRENRKSPKNKYKFLSTMEYERVNGQGLCDLTKLLECGDSGVCECIQNTEPRVAFAKLQSFTVEEVLSDYCYVKSGRCYQDPVLLSSFTESEKLLVTMHYGKPEGDCTNGNICVYVDQTNYLCTTTNTGSTGHDLKPDNVGGEGTSDSPTSAGMSHRFCRDTVEIIVIWGLLASFTEIMR